jgi:hypothetical protein
MTCLQPSAHTRGQQRGATLVEFVVIFPLAVLFVLSLIQFGIVYMMKMELNHAAFMAARAGAMANADPQVIRDTLLRGLNQSFEKQDTASDLERIGKAEALHVQPLRFADITHRLDLTLLNPSPAAFKDFGVVDPTTHVTYIPNDNLEFRSTADGSTSKMNLRDANLLKIKVVYGYDLVVPVVGPMLARIMCGGDIGVDAWGGKISILDSKFLPTSMQCIKYYKNPLSRYPRIPLEAFAIVDMQSPAYKK